MDTISPAATCIDPYIFIDTERRAGPGLFCSFVLTQSIKRIAIPKEVTERLLVAQVDWVGHAVARHFDLNGGILAPFGPITGYVFVRSRDDAIEFDQNGRVVNYFSKPPLEIDGWRSVRAAADRPGSQSASRGRDAYEGSRR